jgi:ABC-type amino acid transport substrate-binding protein
MMMFMNFPFKFNSRRVASTVAVALVCVVLVLSLGCDKPNSGAPNVAQSKGSLGQILSRKEIRAGILIYPPTVDFDKTTGEASGFLVDIANEVSKRAGLRVKYEPVAFDDLKAAISTRYDVIVGGVFVTVPRARDMAFTRPIMYWAGVSAVIPSDKIGNYKALADFNQSGVRIAAITGTAEIDFVKQNLPNATIVPIPNSDVSLAIAEIAAGRADAAFSDLVTAKKYVAGKPGLTIAFGGKTFTANAAGFVVKQGDADWLQFWNDSLLSLQIDGTIKRFSDKYKGDEIWVLPKTPWE